MADSASLRPAARPTSSFRRNQTANCSPKGELSAKLTEGVNGPSADPLRRAARATSPLGEELGAATGELPPEAGEGVNGPSADPLRPGAPVRIA